MLDVNKATRQLKTQLNCRAIQWDLNTRQIFGMKMGVNLFCRAAFFFLSLSLHFLQVKKVGINRYIKTASVHKYFIDNKTTESIIADAFCSYKA